MNISTNKVERMRGIARAVQTRIFAVILMAVIFATTVFAAFSASYTVKIVDDGEATQVVTTRTEPIEILNQTEISLDAMDKIDISSFDPGKGGVISVIRSKGIHIEYFNEVNSYNVYATTVSDAIAEAGYTLSEGDEVNQPLDAKVSEGMVIAIAVAKPVQIVVDNNVMMCSVNYGTVGDLLASRGVVLGEQDIVTPDVSSEVTENMIITVQRVSYADVSETQEIPFTTKTVKSPSLAAGQSQLQTAGVNGEKMITYSVRYVDGVEESRTVTGETVTKEPVTQVHVKGTAQAATVSASAEAALPVSNSSRKWNNITEGTTLSGNATHYCACAVCCGQKDVFRTAAGVTIYNGMANPYIVAANWLPLGTVIRVNGVTYTVSDRGGSTLSPVGRIDIFTPEGHAACQRLGRKNVTIEIVRLGSTN